MKLATFVADGQERFGIVLTHPATGQPWVFDPEAAVPLCLGRHQRLLRQPAAFRGAAPLAAFLALGEAVLTASRPAERR